MAHGAIWSVLRLLPHSHAFACLSSSHFDLVSFHRDINSVLLPKGGSFR